MSEILSFVVGSLAYLPCLLLKQRTFCFVLFCLCEPTIMYVYKNSPCEMRKERRPDLLLLLRGRHVARSLHRSPEISVCYNHHENTQKSY